MNMQGLKTFFSSNIRSVLIYGAPAWFSLLNETDKIRLEKVQRAATRIILPELEYCDRLKALDLPYLVDFLMDLSERHFLKISDDLQHPLHSRITFNRSRMSSRNATTYRPKVARTQKRAKSLFPFFMSRFNS